MDQTRSTNRTPDYVISCATCSATIPVFGGPAFALYLRTHNEQCRDCIEQARRDSARLDAIEASYYREGRGI